MALEHSFRSKSFAKCWRTLSSIAAFMQQQQQTGSTEHSFLVAIDVMFVVAATYWLVCIRPMPKTYLSEIIFPLQFYLRGVASLWLTLVTALVCVYTLGWGGCPDLDERPVALLTTDTAAWGVSTLLIWMEHRRGLRTSPLLLGFWLLRWSLLTKSLWMRVTPQVVGSDSPPFVVVLHMGCLFLCQSVLASAGIWPTRQLTSSSPEVLALARAHIISFSGKSLVHRSTALHSGFSLHQQQHPTPTSYGSIGQAKTLSCATTPQHDVTLPCHPTLKICIPSWTVSRRSESSYVSYKILIMSGHDETWSVRRRYSDFAHLRRGLPSWMTDHVPFPDKSHLQRFAPQVIDTRRALLESFLNVL
ncbi:hypothetical protein, variant 5 [Aphanomyces astaci]|uniref:PX domain-containing protein n=1 Tax=Aphanomyces astaci TaxID=112090 RepID=W4FJ15_APHAT|nr:hypothetical protein, variant 3 [Aphanomyces astaci]XP_009843629.1 hypothetical protein, variant 4 [Aphanomyces astaci]XP_009843630.1 hypothetical protein, variant 5 [Aphanomyces astaci]ETV66824.1 hypothetical protein, variant 3 [Aphanomyces astaci]ETV66825.1 hypothetical protein, variant 4 [Aphanomyces astaci]ETV66826.1 hypothetical protein, variant 5 [Aphanomyces astaci]|eukprot:XP_009843628.1 hypothetical protein, variant 3 [Aphanomyces astaci]